MFVSKNTLIQSSHTPEGGKESCHTSQRKASFFKIFITELNTKSFYCRWDTPSGGQLVPFARQRVCSADLLQGYPVASRPPSGVCGAKLFYGAKLFGASLRKRRRGSRSLPSVYRVSEDPFYQIVRPLLYLSRTEISLICKELLIPVYPDKSNQCIKYSRNRIRKQLLPSLKLFYNPQIEQALFQFSEFLCKEQDFISILSNTVPHNFLKIVKVKNTK